MEKRVFIIISVVFLCSIILSCLPTHNYKIIDIEFTAIGIYDETGFLFEDGNPVFDGKMTFSINYLTEWQGTAQNYFPGLVSSCYATSVGKYLENPLVNETFNLSLDRPFIYKGEIIPAFTNVFDLDDIRKEIVIVGDKDRTNIHGLTLFFSKAFIRDAVFENIVHKVTFSCKTSDDLFFEKKTSVFIR